METNTPYYLINYDDSSNKTDTVTSGFANKKIEILKTTNLKMIPSKWKNLIEAVKEIENFSQELLDIEFAVQSGEVVIFSS